MPRATVKSLHTKGYLTSGAIMFPIRRSVMKETMNLFTEIPGTSLQLSF